MRVFGVALAAAALALSPGRLLLDRAAPSGGCHAPLQRIR